MGAVGIWKISVPSSHFCCKPRAVLNNVVFEKENKNSDLMYLVLQKLCKEMLQYRK